MLKEQEIKNKILTRIERMSNDKLGDILEFLKKIETDNKKKSEILSYAGCWKELDSETLDDLIANILEKRKEDKRRI